MAITKIQSESLNLADDFAFTGTITGAGESNTPAWNAYKSSTQSLVGDTITKITFNTETLDTHNAFTSSTFTVPSGQGGSYFYYCTIRTTYTSDREIVLYLYVNGSLKHGLTSRTSSWGHILSGIVTLSAGDTLEMYYVIAENPVSGVLDAGQDDTKFGGFKITT